MNKLLFTKPDEISDQDFQAVEDVARHLAKNYPPDWLERDGPTLYATTLAISFLVAILVSIVWGPWWSFAIPMIIPGSILIVLPRLFFRRDVGKPRWAHPLVALDPKLTDARQAATEADRRLEVIRTEHAAEIERVTARITQAEERYRASEQRALVEIDRERMAVSKLEKTLESERTVSAASLQRLQSELTHMRIEAVKQARDFAALEEELKNAIEERSIARDTAAQLHALTSDLTGQIVAERARVEVLREQLNRRTPMQTRAAKQGQRGKTLAARRSKTKPAE